MSTDPSEMPRKQAGLVPDAPVAAIAAYADLRTRVSDLMGSIDPDRAAETIVPACPEWTVTDTLAHMVGVTIDIVEGNIGADVGTTAWANGHVSRFSSLGVAGLLDRWAQTAPIIDSLSGLMPARTASQFVFDAATHEQDVRGALASPGARDSTAVQVGFGFLLSGIAQQAELGAMPPLLVRTEGVELVAGPLEDGTEPVRLEAPRFELFRSFGGRRSLDQIRALTWTGDPTPYLAFFEGSPLAPPGAALVE